MKKTNYEIGKEIADQIDANIIEVLQAEKSFRVEAGAGAGKTYSLHKVIEWIDKNKAASYKKGGKQVACITYTNAAADVIASRISSSFIFPSTIHAFIWDNICNFQLPLITAVKERNLLPAGYTLDKIHRVTYDLGIRYVGEDGTLHLFHNDIVELFVWFLNQTKFRRLLADRYTIILIDEYQDSFKCITDLLLEHYIEKNCGPQFGFFGDAWQTIYSNNGACGLIQSDKLIEIKKEANFRSQKVIVDVLNRIRPNLPQRSAVNEEDGEVVVITTNDYSGARSNERYFKGELPDDVLSSYVSSVQEKLSRKGWGEVDKTLMLTHRLLAKQQDYQKLLEVLGNHLRDQDDEHYLFFRDYIEPLFAALEQKDAKRLYDVLGIVRQPIETKRQKKKWKELLDKLDVARQGTIFDVLRVAFNSRLIPIPPKMEAAFEHYLEDGNAPFHETTLKYFYNLRYSEVLHAIEFFKDDSLYSTDHGVKGEEYDNVLFVMGRGWNLYKFEDILWKDQNNLSGKLDAYIRNRNLFYVCCSRPRKRLALLITVKIGAEFQKYLQEVFGAENVVPYNMFINQDK
jgi:hypothetical protein